MMFRGPTLILFGLSMIGAPLAVSLLRAHQSAEQSAPGQVETVNQQNAACASQSLQTAIGRLGCNKGASVAETRRIDANGALFVTARN